MHHDAPPERDIYAESEQHILDRCRRDKLYELFMTDNDNLIYDYTMGLIDDRPDPSDPSQKIGLLYKRYVDATNEGGFSLPAKKQMQRLLNEIKEARLLGSAYEHIGNLRSVCHAMLLVAVLIEPAFFAHIAPLCQRQNELNMFVGNTLKPKMSDLMVGKLITGTSSACIKDTHQLIAFVDACIQGYMRTCYPKIDTPPVRNVADVRHMLQ